MKYINRYFQETVQAATAKEFDLKMSEVFERASHSSKDPQIHYFDFGKFCASVTYHISEAMPETPAEKALHEGCAHECFECPLFTPPTDGRIKWVRCEEAGRRVSATSHACDIFYTRLSPNLIKHQEA